jgi:hypothetical protein
MRPVLPGTARELPMFGREGPESCGHLLVGAWLVVLNAIVVACGSACRRVGVGLQDCALEEVAELRFAALLEVVDLERFLDGTDFSPTVVGCVEHRQHILKAGLPCVGGSAGQRDCERRVLNFGGAPLDLSRLYRAHELEPVIGGSFRASAETDAFAQPAARRRVCGAADAAAKPLLR